MSPFTLQYACFACGYTVNTPCHDTKEPSNVEN